MDKFKNIIKRIAGTLMLPVIMYIAMYILCFSNGKTYFGTLDMWKTLIIDIGVSVTCAMGIGLQFKSGRFDFSGGGIMLITGIISGNFAVSHSSSLFMFIVFNSWTFISFKYFSRNFICLWKNTYSNYNNRYGAYV